MLDDDIIMEDPPNDVVDPVDDRNLPSLGEPEGDEACYLPPPEDPQTDDDSGEKSKCLLLIQLRIYSLFWRSAKSKTDPP